MNRVGPSMIMDLLKTAAGGGFTSFASGLPDPAMFPAADLATAADRELSSSPAGALQYGAAEGYAPLREWIAEHLKTRGLKATVDHILVTNGSQQALDLAARLLIDAGDLVAVETPTYLAALQTFDSYEARYLPFSRAGTDPDETSLAQALGQSAKSIYLLPTHQNPSGLTWSEGARDAAAALIAKSRCTLIEDDAYFDLRYDGEPQIPVSARLDGAIYTGTFSKTIAPGLRVGYLCASPDLVAKLSCLKQITDLTTGSLTQRIVHRFVTDFDYSAHIASVCDTYRRRRDTMLRALKQSMPAGVSWTHPLGGMFLWLTLPEGQDADALLKEAMQHKIIFVPGQSFHPDGGGTNALRLNFVSEPSHRITAGIELLASLIRDQIGRESHTAGELGA